MKKVSVIIVNYNGIKWLPECLTTLTNQTYPKYEIILVDNGSNDESVSYVEQNFSQIKLIKCTENHGFAKGNNIGFDKAAGDYIILINNDTKVYPDFIKDFVQVYIDIPNCDIAQAKIILMDDNGKLDNCGTFWTNTTYLLHYGLYQDVDAPKFNKSFPIFSAKGACMIIKREVIEKIGLFDNTFWSYYEETDFCHRAINSGYTIWYYPNCHCYHAMGATSSKFKQDYVYFHSQKNKLRSYIKNFSGYYLLYVLAVHSFFNLVFVVYILFKFKLSILKSVLLAYVWNIKNIRDTLQIKKQLSDKFVTQNIPTDLIKKPPFKYYVYMLQGRKDFKYE